MPNSGITDLVYRATAVRILTRLGEENERIIRDLFAAVFSEEFSFERLRQIGRLALLTSEVDSLLQGLTSADDIFVELSEEFASTVRSTQRAQRNIRDSLLRSARPTSGRPPPRSLDLFLPEILGRPRPTLNISEEVTHEAPMTTEQIKQSIQSRPETNQDIKFLNKKKCGVCLGSWKEILMEGKHLVFTKCGHIFCRDCAIRFASEGKRECPLCKKSLAGVNPPFRRLHMPLDPRLKKSRGD